MEENMLKLKYNELLTRYKNGAQYLSEHQEDEKAKKELQKIEKELSKIIEALPNITEEEKTEGFAVEVYENVEEPVEQPVEKPKEPTTQIAVKQEPTTELSNFTDNWKIATQIAKSDIVPDNFKNKPQNVVIALSLANRMKLEPFTVMQNMSMIKGKVSWSGSFCRTLIERSGKYKDLELNYVGEKGKDTYGCYLSATRISDGKRIDGPEVTIAMAKAEKWTSNPKWATLTDLMLAYRCQSYFCRIHCPETMSGIYTTEEIEDINTNREQPQDIL
jgi:hypothetical protein